MTPERLAEIRALLVAATPGPWEYYEEEYDCRPLPSVGSATGFVASTSDGPGEDTDVMRYQANAEFIAAAPAIVAELLAEVERLANVWIRLARNTDEPDPPNENERPSEVEVVSVPRGSIVVVRDRGWGEGDIDGAKTKRWAASVARQIGHEEFAVVVQGHEATLSVIACPTSGLGQAIGQAAFADLLQENKRTREGSL